MAQLLIVTGIENTILRTKSVVVKKINKNIKKLVADMTDTVIAVDGLGIAAPQVGVNLRIYIARLNHGTSHEMWVPMINAQLISVSNEKEIHEEGCLSIPGKFGEVERSKKVTVSYTDTKGITHTLHLEGLNARIMQHELDHLNGTLIADKWRKKE